MYWDPLLALLKKLNNSPSSFLVPAWWFLVPLSPLFITPVFLNRSPMTLNEVGTNPLSLVGEWKAVSSGPQQFAVATQTASSYHKEIGGWWKQEPRLTQAFSQPYPPTQLSSFIGHAAARRGDAEIWCEHNPLLQIEETLPEGGLGEGTRFLLMTSEHNPSFSHYSKTPSWLLLSANCLRTYCVKEQ